MYYMPSPRSSASSGNSSMVYLLLFCCCCTIMIGLGVGGYFYFFDDKCGEQNGNKIIYFFKSYSICILAVSEQLQEKFGNIVCFVFIPEVFNW